MLMRGSAWRLPISKSLGSCAGVIFTAPVPKRVHVRVGDDDHAPLREEGMRELLADDRRVALVVWMHGDGHVAEHRLGARRGHDDLARAVLQRVGEAPELAVLLLVVDLLVGEGGEELRVPVDEALASIDEPLLPEAHEGLDHGALHIASMVKRSRDQSARRPSP
jgi:hypothetical protein